MNRKFEYELYRHYGLFQNIYSQYDHILDMLKLTSNCLCIYYLCGIKSLLFKLYLFICQEIKLNYIFSLTTF